LFAAASQSFQSASADLVPVDDLPECECENISLAFSYKWPYSNINPLNAKLNPICYLLALLGGHLIFYVSRIRVKGH
jgi:hypothetical protein